MLADIHEILKCPVSGELLRPLSIHELRGLNHRIRCGHLSRVDGTAVRHEMEGGYVTGSQRFAYPVKEGIITLMSNLAIVIDNQYVARDTSQVLSGKTRQVQSFYDKVGWQHTKDGKYEDTSRFVDNRPVVLNYLGSCNKRIVKHIARRGRYIVDVACGAIHYDAYRAMSDGYDYRICIDVSLQALREAKKNMGDRGIYVMADITNMPLRDQSVDDVISLHTLYHVPADKQVTALNEIHRILKPGAAAVVIYRWGKQSLLMRAAMSPVRALNRMRSSPEQVHRPNNTGGRQLYAYTHNYSFFKRQQRSFDMDIVVWSSLSSAFTKSYIPDGLLGFLLLKIVKKLEDYMPHALGRFGQYPLFVLKRGTPKD